ncbi:glycosyltransferase [Pseudomonas sp. LMG 31766]|uniref:Glycosyltransferase n=1 Tax=Pseudomonas chaetocerotis TaxID=2758695 RepID=A0A931D1N5_9PSED|nr:glycosyltransferase [Pseudomonas chaetocerotis]MBZ9664913.1 glycosyltransferase [Pseudomonas chaetocerotis]
MKIDADSINQPLISVVLPVYNAVEHIEISVQSILVQKVREFELIIINDGSTDGSAAILERLAKLDSRIILISRENRGLVSTLNEGVAKSRGKWIARMDADDIALPDRFLRQLQQLEVTKSDICGTWIRLFGASSKHVIKHAETHEAIAVELLFGSPFAHPTVMMRAALAKGLPYDATWEKCEDYDLWRRAFLAGWRMTNVPEPLLLYRQHSAQISTASLSEQQILTHKVRQEYWQSVSSSLGLSTADFQEILKLRSSSKEGVDMDKVDSVVNSLLANATGEARAVVTDQSLRLYYRAASQCSNISSRWANLHHEAPASFSVRLKLWVLSKLRIKSESKAFGFLKAIYWRLNG